MRWHDKSELRMQSTVFDSGLIRGELGKSRFETWPSPASISADFMIAILPLFLGSLIYVLYRSKAILVFSWIKGIGLIDFVDHSRRFFQHNLPIGHGWLLYSAPTGLWAFSLLFFVLRVWDGSSGVSKFCSIGAAITLAEGSEIGQMTIIPGTYDPIDLLCNSTGLMAAWGASYARAKISAIP